jgi:hypothetical protein
MSAELVLRKMRATPIGAKTYLHPLSAELGIRVDVVVEVLRRHAFEFPETSPGVFTHANPTWPLDGPPKPA